MVSFVVGGGPRWLEVVCCSATTQLFARSLASNLAGATGVAEMGGPMVEAAVPGGVFPHPSALISLPPARRHTRVALGILSRVLAARVLF